MRVWEDLLLHKIAPLCPRLALKLRLVCKHLALHIGTPKIQYIKHRECYETPTRWFETGWFATAVLIDESGLIPYTNLSRSVQYFISTLFPYIRRQNKWIAQMECLGDLMRIQITVDPIMPYTSSDMVPLIIPPQTCCLGCDNDSSLICRPLLSWYWNITYDPEVDRYIIEQRKKK